MVTKPVIIPLPIAHLRRTVNLQGKRKETTARAGKTKLKVDKVVVHEVDEYYTLSEGGRFMNCKGMPDVENTES
jgi:hypothetical protein